MKLVRCNGKVLTVQDVGPVLMEFQTTGVPIKCVNEIMDDDQAREHVRDLLGLGIYARIK